MLGRQGIAMLRDPLQPCVCLVLEHWNDTPGKILRTFTIVAVCEL